MSVEAMSDCWGEHFPAKGCPEVHASTVRLVALAIADVVNDMNANEFFATLTTLAGKVDLHRDTVRRVIRHLVDVGVLATIEAPHPGSTAPGVYRWIWQPPDYPQASASSRSRSRRIRDPRTGKMSKPQVRGRGNSATGRGLFRDQVADCSATEPNRDQLNNAPEPANRCSTCGGTLFISKEYTVTGRSQWESAPCPDCHPINGRSASARRSR